MRGHRRRHAYRLGGGGNYPDLATKCIHPEIMKTVRDSIIDFVGSPENPSGLMTTRFRFAPVNSASAIFETGRRSLAFSSVINDLGLETLAVTNADFQQFRVKF